MTDMEKRVITRVCAKIIVESDFYTADTEMKALIDWLMLTDHLKKNNDKIREMTKEYCNLEQNRRNGEKEVIERSKILCEERSSLYEEQQEIKDKIRKIEKLFIS